MAVLPVCTASLALAPLLEIVLEAIFALETLPAQHHPKEKQEDLAPKDFSALL